MNENVPNPAARRQSTPSVRTPSPVPCAPANHAVSEERIDEALEAFEQGWKSDSDYLERVVRHFAFESCPAGLSELIRADIDRRYSASLEVDLNRYFSAYPQLLNNGEAAAAIAFEDFRARVSRGLITPRARWGWIPSVGGTSWYRQLPGTEARDVFQSDTPGTSSPLVDGQPSDEPRVGGRFGDFQLLALLGTGAFSRVFLATQQSLASRYVAVKVVKRSLAEPAHLARLQHTGIVPLYSFHRIGEYSVLCMPYYGSATIVDWLDLAASDSVRTGRTMIETVEEAQRRLTQRSPQTPAAAERAASQKEMAAGPPAEETGMAAVRLWHATGTRPLQRLASLDAKAMTLWLAQRITSALAHAHDRGIVHGDLKPANILLRNDGEPALIDFNLARSADGEPNAWIGGTLPYMSPEQLRSLLGRQALISPASDIYSLGVILYEIVEGRLPFPVPASAAEDDVASALQQRTAARLSWSGNDCSEGMRSIIGKCLSFDEQDRYASAGELLEDVEREAANLPLAHAGDPVLRGRLPKFVRRHPRIFSAAPIALVSLLVILVLASLGYQWRASSLALSARANLDRLDHYGRRTVASLIDADTGRAQAVVRSMPDQLSDILEATPERIGSSPLFAHLAPRQQAAARRATFDYCLAAAALALERAAQLDEPDWRAVELLLQGCRQFPDLAADSRQLARLQSKLAWHTEGQRPDEIESPPSPRSPRPLETVLESRGLLALGQPRRALQRLQAIAAIPEPAVLFWITVGQAQMELGQYEAAGLSFSLAVEDAPRSAAGYAQRAAAHQALRDWSAVERDYTQAIQLEPRRASHWANRALARERRDDFRGACDDLTAALGRQPESNRLLLMRSRMLRRLGEQTAARDDFLEAIRVRPQSVPDWISRALAQLPRHPERALADLKRAEQLDPHSADVQQNLAHVQAEHLRDNEAALRSLDKILQQQPRHEMARGGRCVLLARRGEVDKALADVEFLASTLDKPQPATIYQMACAHALLSEQREPSRREAIRLLARAIRLGYGTDLLDHDPDLEPLRHLGEFKTLTEMVRLSRD